MKYISLEIFNNNNLEIHFIAEVLIREYVWGYFILKQD